MLCMLYLLITFACCVLSRPTCAAAAVVGVAVHDGEQASRSAAVAAPASSTPRVAAAVLPTHGSSCESAADAAHALACSLAAFASSLIVVTPAPQPAAHDSGLNKSLGCRQLPPQLHHDIQWTGDSSAALNAAAGVAHASGLAWLFVAVAGDTVTVQDAGLVLQQLRDSCGNEQVLACHSSLQDPRVQGHFVGPVLPIYIPDTTSSTSSSSSSSSNAAQNCKQCEEGCPLGVKPDRLTLEGILYQPAAPDHGQLRSRVSLLRQHLPTDPLHAAWWHLQLSAAFETLGSLQHAQQHLDAAYGAATSCRLAAAVMYKLAEMRLTAGDLQGAVAAAARGVARHVTPDLLWIAALASYRAGDFRAAVAWGEMAARLACGEGACSVDRPAAFVDVAAWYEQPYDVLRWAYRHWVTKEAAAAEREERSWAAATALRGQQVAGNSSSRFIVLGLQALPLLQQYGQVEDAWHPPPEPPQPRVAGSITTAHRPELFRRCWHSFRARCLDCHKLVTKWYAVDDGSSPEVLAQMQLDAPPCTVEWLEKAPQQAGHAGSLSRILQEVRAQGIDFLLHLEDDWYFTTDDAFISKALRVMEHDSSVAQVLFNQDYADTDAPWERQLLAAAHPRITSDGLQYLLHVYGGPQGSPELAAYVAQHGDGKLHNFHWPGFSLRPGVWRLSAVKQVGEFTAGPQFEHAFASKLHAAGYKVAFLPGVAAVHMAPTAAWLQERQADIHDVYSRHGLQLQHAHGDQSSAYAANMAWR